MRLRTSVKPDRVVGALDRAKNVIGSSKWRRLTVLVPSTLKSMYTVSTLDLIILLPTLPGVLQTRLSEYKQLNILL